MKENFINSEIWILTFGGAFQRSNLYKPEVPEKERKYFRNMITGFVENMLEEYKSNVSEEKHIQNIRDLSNYSVNFKNILNNERMNFGISQKLLNLYLKYQWCLNNIVEPPHFPVDRIIQQKIKSYPIISWTQIIDSKDYISIINKARVIAKSEKISLAELELRLFYRRINNN